MGRSVALVGMAETSRRLAPFDDPEWEIWGLNEAYARKNKMKKPANWPKDKPLPAYMKRWTRWFQMHPLWDALRMNNFNHLNHPLWLSNQKGQCLVCSGHGRVGDKECEDCYGTGFYDPALDKRNEPFPIYTIAANEGVPNSVTYPLKEIVSHFSGQIRAENARYFTSTFPQMCALLVYEHDNGQTVDEVGFYGIEMKSDEEYGFQKPCMEFWIGVIFGRGIKVTIPEGCSLLGERERLYGYEKLQGQYSKMHSEIRCRALEQQAQKAQAQANKIIGQREKLTLLMKSEKGQSATRRNQVQAQYNKLIEAEINAVIAVNSTNAALQEQKYVKRELAAQHTEADIWVVSPKGVRTKIEVPMEGFADSDIIDSIEVADETLY